MEHLELVQRLYWMESAASSSVWSLLKGSRHGPYGELRSKSERSAR